MKTLFLSILLTLSASCFAASTEFKTPESVDVELAKGQPIVVLMRADWCPACKAFAPTYEKLSEQMSLKFFTVNVDNPAMGANAPAIPFAVVLKQQGTKVQGCGAFEGAVTAEEAKKAILQCLTQMK